MFHTRHFSDNPQRPTTNPTSNQNETSNLPVNTETTSPTESPPSSDEVPEAPAAGKKLLRDSFIFFALAVGVSLVWQKYRSMKLNYDDTTVTKVNAIRAHLTHANSASDFSTRDYHLSEAEKCCREALAEQGGGYFGTEMSPIATSSTSGGDISAPVAFDSGIVGLHLQLGRICGLRKQYKDAIENYLIVLKAMSHEFGFQSPELVSPCRQISEFYAALSSFSLAEHFLDRALDLTKPSQEEYGQICEQYAILLRKQGKWDKSLEYSKKALESGRKSLGADHLQTASILLGWSCSLLETERLEECEKRAREAIRVVEAQDFPPVELQCSALFILGKCLMAQHRLDEAERVLKMTLKLSVDQEQTKQLMIHDCLRAVAKARAKLREKEDTM